MGSDPDQGAKGRSFAAGELRDLLPWLVPLLLFLLGYVLLPVAGTMVSSLFRETTFLESRFVFLENYLSLAADAGFRESVRFTFLFVLVSVPLEIMLGLSLALVINNPSRFRTLLRATVLIPWAIPAVISGRIWELIYNYEYGLANVLSRGLDGSAEPVNWLGSSEGAFAALVVADVWKTTPFVCILLLAGLQTIPSEVFQQARIDRAGLFQRFFRITLPLLKPVLLVALVFRTIDATRIFDMAYVITGGGPGGATTPLSLYAYRYFLSGDFGYGAAISVVLFIAALGLSLMYVNLGALRREIG